MTFDLIEDLAIGRRCLIQLLISPEKDTCLCWYALQRLFVLLFGYCTSPPPPPTEHSLRTNLAKDFIPQSSLGCMCCIECEQQHQNCTPLRPVTTFQLTCVAHEQVDLLHHVHKDLIVLIHDIRSSPADSTCHCERGIPSLLRALHLQGCSTVAKVLSVLLHPQLT